MVKIIDWFCENIPYIIAGGITLFIIVCTVCLIFNWIYGAFTTPPLPKMTKEEWEDFEAEYYDKHWE